MSIRCLEASYAPHTRCPPLIRRSAWRGPLRNWTSALRRSLRSSAKVGFLTAAPVSIDPEAFSKIKHLVRKEGALVREALVEAIGRALAAVTPEDAAGWFAHAGYWPQDQPL
jgi:hypothetical protein